MYRRIAHNRRTFAALASSAAVAAGLLTGCASSSGGGTPTPSVNPGGPNSGAPSQPQMSQTVLTPSSANTSDTAGCTPSTMQTHTAGTLTVATDSPAYEPWFENNDPTNGKGFESAVAYAVAKQLGYSADQVTWTEAFNNVIAPTPKDFDFDINEVSITPARAQVVDFSSGYYDVTQAIVALKGSSIANATSIADLKSAKLGAQTGTTSYDAIKDVIKPSSSPLEYPTNPLAVQALKNGQIDGLVVDLPTGLYLTAAEVPDSTIVGQLPVQSNPEQFGLVLDHDSPLTPCVTQAVDALRKDGTLADLQKKWLTSSAGAPVLK